MTKLAALSLAAALAAPLVVAAAAPAHAAANSTWQTEFGPLTLAVSGDGAAEGSYPQYKGAVYGEFNFKTNTLTAVWVQPSSERRCATQRQGSPYWGRVSWTLSARGSMVGKWAYCDDALGTGGAWNGQLIKGNNPAN